MNSFLPGQGRPPKRHPSKLSPGELAEFLTDLAAIYSSPTYGNSALADALRELATTVREKTPSQVRGNKTKDEALRELSLDQLAALKVLNQAEIRAFLSDESKTKIELLCLASARFSMPVSQLKRMKTTEVREAIHSALLHESSIEILSEEAGREGANRGS